MNFENRLRGDDHWVNGPLWRRAMITDAAKGDGDLIGVGHAYAVRPAARSGAQAETVDVGAQGPIEDHFPGHCALLGSLAQSAIELFE